jgi:hypothetical protein
MPLVSKNIPEEILKDGVSDADLNIGIYLTDLRVINLVHRFIKT